MSISVNELRIGNWVNTPDGARVILGINNWGKITVRTNPPEIEPSTAYFPYTESECQPIPLTPEILEKCGFEKESYEMSGCEVWNFPNTFWRVARSYRDENEYKLWGKLVSPPTWNLRTFQYLHELQNIIFALTGEELNYTP